MWQSLRKVYLDSRKPADSIFNIYVARPLATPLVIFFEKFKMTPNQVSLLGLLTMLAAGLSWATVFWTETSQINHVVHLWTGLVLLELAYLFDCADGQLARRTGLTSQLGAEFDFLVDEIKAYILVSGLTVYWWATTEHGTEALIWGSGGLLAVASAISMTRFVRSEVVQTDGMVGRQVHGDSASSRQNKTRFWWVLMPARVITQYPQSLPFFVFFEAIDIFIKLYVTLHAVYAVGRLCQLSLRLGLR